MAYRTRKYNYQKNELIKYFISDFVLKLQFVCDILTSRVALALGTLASPEAN